MAKRKQRTEERVKSLVQEYVKHYAGQPHSLSLNEVDEQIRGSGEAAIPVLESLLSEGSIARRIAAVWGLSAIGRPGLKGLVQASKDEESAVRLAAVRALGKIGEPALLALTDALDDTEIEVRRAAVAGLGNVGPPAVGALTAALSDEGINFQVVRRLAALGEPALSALARALEHEEKHLRRLTIAGLFRIGQPAAHLLASALEDASRENRELVLRYLADDAHGRELGEPCLISPMETADAILQELIARGPGRSSERFNPGVTAKALSVTIARDPALLSTVLRKMSDLAYANSGDLRERVVLVGRELAEPEFAHMVKSRMREDPRAAAEILTGLGGRHGQARFAETPGPGLAEYWAHLVELESATRKRWQEMVPTAQRSVRTSVLLSLAVFIVGTGIIVGAFVLLARADEPWQQVAAALGVVGVFFTMYRQQFWKGPTEQIQALAEQQARLHAAFIGYMNRVAQLRLVFEDAFAKGEIGLSELDRFQCLLKSATEQAWRQVREQTEDDDWV